MTATNSRKIKSQQASNQPPVTDLRVALLSWYKEYQRALPWRQSRDPYRIWISEVMLQQTTVAAVVPYYERFLSRFPSVETLASSSSTDVMTMWSGLGYYSRARNLHLAAQIICNEFNSKFPKTWKALIELPGFGPYTSRAVSSLAFDEAVGVLDGNVIRVLSRVNGLSLDWWKPNAREQLQSQSDALAAASDSASINQALMDLGATVCTPQSPICTLCPWNKLCVAKKENLVESLPKRKPRRKMETWIWKPAVILKQGKVAMVTDPKAPVLKNKLLLPGSFTKSTRPPARFDLKHSITHHNIYIQKQKNVKLKDLTKEKIQWVPLKEIKKHNPSSMIQKIIHGT